MAHNYVQKNSIVIPLKNSAEDEIIEIGFDDLPDGEEVLQILKGERAALHFWLDLALEYYRRGCIADFVKILEQCGEEAGLDYPDYEKDQMRALDMLAAYYVLQGNKKENREHKKDWFTKATLLYTTADKIIMYDQNHLLGRAYFCLLEGNKIDQADAQFNFVINQAANTESVKSIPAMMGKACIAFSRKEYKSALFFYKKCLRLNPNCPADIRVGMGYCLSRLGQHEKARMAFERAYELDPENIPAIVALAILDINTMEQAGIRSGIQKLSIAYQKEMHNPVVLNHLANHFFYKQDLGKTEQLAWHAFQQTDNEAMRAESCYHMARCFHKNGDYDHAFRYYYQATQFNHPKFILPYYGLGQIYIQREDYDNAIAAFEKVLKVVPSNYETLSVLGSLYSYVDQRKSRGDAPTGAAKVGDNRHNNTTLSNRGEEALRLLTKVVDMCPDDIEALLELARLQEQSDPQASLKLYLRVCELLQDTVNAQVPAEILNNIGSLYFALADYEKSKQFFDEARNSVLGLLENEANDELTSLLVTISYNLGRANEALCLFDEAEKLYRGIIKQRPSYIDCVLRLGCLFRDKGDNYNASLLFKECLAINSANPDAWTLIGNMHMAKNELGPAQKKFEHILKLPTGQHDAYSHVALGNIWLKTLFSLRNKDKERHRKSALFYFEKALKLRPKNIWAANGIGCVLANKGEFLEARDIFSQVREATADFADVWINIAHIYMEQQQYVSALQMYKNCMHKFGRQRDVQLMMYVARAYWRAGKYADCREMVEKAIAEAPEDLLFKFNHSVVMQRMAMNVLRDEKSSLQLVTSAVEDLKNAERTFNYIAGMSNEVIKHYPYISRTICGAQANACSDLLKQARTYLQRAQTKDEEERRIRERQEEERRELERQREEEERQRQEEKLRELEALKAMRQHYVEKTKEILKMHPQVAEKAEKKSQGRSRRRREENNDFVNDSSDLGEYADGGGEGPSRKEKKLRRKRDRRETSGAESSDGNGGRSTAPRRKKPAIKEAREVDDIPARMRGKVKSKAFLSSSSSSSGSDRENANAAREKAAAAAIDSEDEAVATVPIRQRLGSSSAESSNDGSGSAKHRRSANSDVDEEESATTHSSPFKAKKRMQIDSDEEGEEEEEANHSANDVEENAPRAEMSSEEEENGEQSDGESPLPAHTSKEVIESDSDDSD